MKVLIYTNPFVVRGNPGFYAGAVERKLAPQARALVASGAEVSFLGSTGDAKVFAQCSGAVRLLPVAPSLLLDRVGQLDSIEDELYRGGDSVVVQRYVELVEEVLGDLRPDVVLAWETPANFLRKLLPEAMVVHEMPGFLSRVPFPELYTFDSEGLFSEGMTYDARGGQAPDPRAYQVLTELQEGLLPFVEEVSPFSRASLDPVRSFDRLVLLPLQVSDQYAFRVDAPFSTQFELLVAVLRQAPPRVGVVVTQYTAGGATDRPLNQATFRQLRETFPSLVYREEFDNLDNVSQYLLPCVDGVVSFSSSIAVQALLWRKDVFVFPESHLASLSTHSTLQDFMEGGPGAHVGQGLDRLAWMLSYQQPLSQLVLNDDGFLFQWLSALLKRPSASELPSFFDTSADYQRAFARAEKREKSLVQVSIEGQANGRLEREFRKSISELKPELISFDVFDTLLDRCVEQPVHVFSFVAEEVFQASGGKVRDFASARVRAERECREDIARPGPEVEVLLDDIYLKLGSYFGLEPNEVSHIKEIELRAEKKFLCTRSAGRRLYDLAVNSGARIVAISDMYLPQQFVSDRLTEAGFELELYLSSSVGARKHDGGLYSHVAEVEGVSPERWLHVGDNPRGDVEEANKLGIGTFYLSSASHMVQRNKKLGPLVRTDRKSRTVSESFIYGALQRRFFDDPFGCPPSDTHFGCDPFNLGYMAAGPVFYGFLQWVMVQAKNDGIERLAFLSRDGQILWRMAQVLFPVEEGWPESAYVLSSRRAARVASIRNRGDIVALAESSIADSTVWSLFEGKFGVRLDDRHLAKIRQRGFRSAEDVISPQADREKVRGLALDLAEEILIVAATERASLSDYYRKLGVCEGARVGVVDIGYAGTMQTAMQEITGCSPLFGYYYITFASALANAMRTGPMRGYAGEFVQPLAHPAAICSNGFFFETIFCAPEPSFLAFGRGADGVAFPRFDVASLDSKTLDLVDRIHLGALALAHDLRRVVGDRVLGMPLSSAAAERLMVSFLTTPGGRDAELFEGVKFADGFAGSSSRYLVPPREHLVEGSRSTADAIWRAGAEVFARRPDIGARDEASQERALKSVNGSHSMQPAAVSLESAVVHRVLGGRKLAKYERDRMAFFSDMKSPLGRLYWEHLGKRLRPRGQ